MGRSVVAEPIPPAGAAAPAGGPTDEALIERVRAGDAAAFDLVVGRHMRRAFAVAYRLLGHREDAEDLVQEAFLTVLERIDSFQPGRPFAPWFYRILVNRGLNARKARALRTTEPLAPDAAAPGASPARDAERAELRERLGAALEALPERQATIVKLFELEGFTSREIAEILEIPDGTVRWHLHQARAALREALAIFGGVTR
jgi:RNA polymerase sigma-70 factor (ECF subfamily)